MYRRLEVTSFRRQHFIVATREDELCVVLKQNRIQHWMDEGTRTARQ